MTIDAEAIARVLDGRATPEERARLLAQADESPELLALLADSAAGMNAQGETGAGVVPIESRRRSRVSRSAWMAIAAVLVIGVAIPSVWRARGDLPPAPIMMIEGSPETGAAARIGALLSTTRGAASSSRVEQSVMLGARVTDYSLLANSRDTSALTVAIEIAAALRSIPGGTAAAAEFDRLASATRPEPLTAQALTAVEQVTDQRAFRIATWLELVRLAAASRSTAFVEMPEVRPAFRDIAGDRTLSTQTRLSIDQIRSALESSPPDWTILDRVPGQALAEFSRRP